MRAILLSLILLPQLALAAGDSGGRPNENDPRCGEARKKQDAPPANQYYKIGGLCSWDGRWKRVEDSPKMKEMLKYLSLQVHRQVLVTDCFRNASDQLSTLCKSGCKPYGTRDCTGRVADPSKSPSQHTVGIAADVQLREFAGSPKGLCQLLSEMRNSVNGGRGGISNYGGGDAHIDLLPDACNWGECERFLGEGICKRTKYNVKKAALEAQLLEAKKQNSITILLELQKQLEELERSATPPKGGS